MLKYVLVQLRSLPDPKQCPLSSTVRPQAINSANKKVSAILVSDFTLKDWPLRSSYMKFSPEKKAEVARYTMESRNK